MVRELDSNMEPMSDSDEPTKAELEQRVKELEKTVEKMLPGRRGFLKASGAAVATGVLGLSAGSSQARSSDSSVASLPPDNNQASIQSSEGDSDKDDADARFWTVGSDYFASNKEGDIDDGADPNSVWTSLMSNIDTGDKISVATGVYKFQGAPEVTVPCTIKGASRVNEFLTVEPSGVVFQQHSTGEHGLLVSVSDHRQVNIKNLSVEFKGPHEGTETGHGFAAIPPANGSGQRKDGIVEPEWRNLTVHGHDGDHYGFFLTNAHQGAFSLLQTRGGGGIEFRNDSGGFHHGNFSVYDTHHVMPFEGGAHGVHYNAQNEQINIIRFEHCSIRRTNDNAGECITYTENPDGTDTKVRRIQMPSINLEGGSTNAVAELPRGQWSSASGMMIEPGFDVSGLPIDGEDNWDRNNSVLRREENWNGGSFNTWYQNTEGRGVEMAIELKNGGTVGTDVVDTVFRVASPSSSPSARADGKPVYTLETREAKDTITMKVPNGVWFRLNSYGSEKLSRWNILYS